MYFIARVYAYAHARYQSWSWLTALATWHSNRYLLHILQLWPNVDRQQCIVICGATMKQFVIRAEDSGNFGTTKYFFFTMLRTFSLYRSDRLIITIIGQNRFIVPLLRSISLIQTIIFCSWKEFKVFNPNEIVKKMRIFYKAKFFSIAV